MCQKMDTYWHQNALFNMEYTKNIFPIPSAKMNALFQDKNKGFFSNQ